MTRERVVQISVLCWLAIVYVWLWGDISVGNILAGLVIGALVMWSLRLPRVRVEGRVHVLSILQLILLTGYYALESSAQVAWLAIRPGPLPPTGVLRIRLQIESDLVLVLCCDVLNLIPGTMVLEIDKARRTVYVHVIDVGSTKAVGKFYRSTRRLEKLFIDGFESNRKQAGAEQ
ncbi:Na+/H+ antiporter subunit E [Antrihabitans sp. YC2-6]|uniref:Na+/H+ antiporter subunit E n=1 Tax=Antrihabitans sp. YC2-6 TaxID=2799498 RepID=UPI0018F56F85|nr:Na+/H+ antiporter subunit E [Antrihabitans sp. YC2-6]MBJ8348595.1 Na+/H+ antiporter subunit E [Antrihabitans sp. YC2-6]